jgi:hypothetical protein
MSLSNESAQAQFVSIVTVTEDESYLSEQLNAHEKMQKYLCMQLVISRVLSASKGHLILAMAPWMLEYGFLQCHPVIFK